MSVCLDSSPGGCHRLFVAAVTPHAHHADTQSHLARKRQRLPPTTKWKQELLAKIFSVAHIGATGLTAVSSALAHSQQNESVLLVTSAPEPPVSTANASGSPHCCAGRRRPSTIVAFGGHHLHMLHNGHLGLATSVSNSTPLDRGAQARHRRQNHMPLGGKQTIAFLCENAERTRASEVQQLSLVSLRTATINQSAWLQMPAALEAVMQDKELCSSIRTRASMRTPCTAGSDSQALAQFCTDQQQHAYVPARARGRRRVCAKETSEEAWRRS